jgi:Putative beta-barrel porin-2, OmpL-like. bbp2
MKYFISLYIITMFFVDIIAQEDSLSNINVNAFADFYYGIDINNPHNSEKPNFIYNHKRQNELSLNLLLLNAKFKERNTRSNIGLMLGNYAQFNLSSEPDWAKFIYEANVGFKISKTNNLWLDIGVFPSHIGFESAISADCWTISRSLVAENSPYYETGVKVSYLSNNEKLNVTALILNGWQKIQKPIGINKPSLGFQFNYKISKNININYSNFIGSDQPDSTHAIRTYHNLYIIADNSKFSYTFGLDIGTDKNQDFKYKYWYTPVGIIRYTINKNSKIAIRAEYFNDENKLIIPNNYTEGVKALGFSTNFDYQISPRIQWRIEARLLKAKNIYINNTSQTILSNLTFRL